MRGCVKLEAGPQVQLCEQLTDRSHAEGTKVLLLFPVALGLDGQTVEVGALQMKDSEWRWRTLRVKGQ